MNQIQNAPFYLPAIDAPPKVGTSYIFCFVKRIETSKILALS